MIKNNYVLLGTALILILIVVLRFNPAPKGESADYLPYDPIHLACPDGLYDWIRNLSDPYNLQFFISEVKRGCTFESAFGSSKPTSTHADYTVTSDNDPRFPIQVPTGHSATIKFKAPEPTSTLKTWSCPILTHSRFQGMRTGNPTNINLHKGTFDIQTTGSQTPQSLGYSDCEPVTFDFKQKVIPHQ